jgi:predicted ATPase
MIETFEAQGYGCLRNVSMKLTPLHAFIGPNDSGKSTILTAVRTVAQVATGSARLTDTDNIRLNREGVSLIATGRSGSFGIEWQGGGLGRVWKADERTAHERGLTGMQATPDDWRLSVLKDLRGAMTVRFDPAALRQASKLIPEGKQVEFVSERGLGLPGIYQAILGRDVEAFTSIRESVRRLFPTVKNLRVTPVSESELVLETELVDGTRVRPLLMSDGLLYYLGFAAIPYRAPVRVLLVEEPENGLHPARIHDVVVLIREFVKSRKTQVLMATHSPLVVNELLPDEVSVVTRDPKRGTQVRLIKDTPNFDRRSKAAELGELWLSYADGVEEAPLLGNQSAAS